MMPLSRLTHVLRDGPPGRRIQAWAGLLLVAATILWIVTTALFYLWRLLPVLLLLAAGIWLLLRSSRGSRPSC